jgi:hypothetical protein
MNTYAGEGGWLVQRTLIPAFSQREKETFSPFGREGREAPSEGKER